MRKVTLNGVGHVKTRPRWFLFDARRGRLVWLAAVMAFGIAARCAGQSNSQHGFQGFSPGDIVRVKAAKPPIELGRAHFQSETASNIVVTSRGDSYCLDKATVILSLPVEGSDRQQVSTTTAAQPATQALLVQPAETPLGMENPEATPLTQMQAVEYQIIGKHKGDNGYEAAAKYYQETMGGVLSGQVSLENLVAQAEEKLKTVDQYQPERAKDPRFEEQIRQLREFVQRARSGERIVTGAKGIE
jgi:hypothetical protein